jgi:hypothetical protein
MGPLSQANSSADGRLKERAARILNAPMDSRRSSVSAITGLTFLALVTAACVTAADDNFQAGEVPFAIRVVDKTLDGDLLRGPRETDRVQISLPAGLPPEAVWLKRAGGMESVVATEAHTSIGPDGRPHVAFTFAWSGDASQRFNALMRENIGHRLAVVVDGKVVSTPTVPADFDNIRVEDSARAVATSARSIVQHVTFEGTSQADPSVVIARLSSTSTGPQHSAAVAIGDALRTRLESGAFSDLHSDFDPETSIRSIRIVAQ